MNRRQLVVAAAAGALLAGTVALQHTACAQNNMKRVLVVTHAAGFRHSSRDTAGAVVQFLGTVTHQWQVVGDATTKEQLQSWITPEKLKDVDLVFFANTTGDLGLTPDQKKTFYTWIENGGNWAGVHSAGDTYHDDPDYLNLVRGEFKTHGPQVKVEARVQDPSHPATKDLPATFEVFDEIYEYKNWDRGRVHVLLSMNKHPQTKEPGDYPIAWTNRVGKGRMFYTSLGHREDMYLNPLYLKHLIGGLRWALGLESGDDTPGNPIK